VQYPFAVITFLPTLGTFLEISAIKTQALPVVKKKMWKKLREGGSGSAEWLFCLTCRVVFSTMITCHRGRKMAIVGSAAALSAYYLASTVSPH
jgi:hypothetical protein